MKKYLPLFLLSFILTACAPQVQRVVSYFDYAPITNAYGVNFTESDAVSFDYQALGSICVIETSGYVTRNDGNAKKDGIYGTTETKKDYSMASGQSVLELLAKEAKAAGGDYVLKLNIEPIKYNNTAAYQATGMVVKRK